MPELEEEKEPKTETANLSEIAGGITDNMPTPNESAINEHIAETEKQDEINNTLFDSKGFSFDKDVHKVDKSGNPVLTSTGKLTRKSGRKPGTKPVKNVSTLGTTSQLPNNTTPENLEQKQSALISVDCLLTFSQMFGGEEFAPKVDVKSGLDERETMSQAFEKYYIAKGVGDIPPGVLLAITLTGYFGPRFFMPQTKSRMGKIKYWFKSKFMKGKKDAQSDTGDNRQRENSFGETTSEGVPIKQL
jgi:hypothetical protein